MIENNSSYPQRLYNNTIGGGERNEIATQGCYSCVYRNFIGSGYRNYIIAGDYRYSSCNFIGGGCQNGIVSSTSSSIGGGRSNTMEANCYSFIGGGYRNLMTKSGCYNTIGGGGNNRVTDFARFSSIVGGRYNRIVGAYACCNFIGGGCYNRIQNSSCNSILGGRQNYIGPNYTNSHIIGSYLSANASNTTFVNNLTASGIIKYSGTFRIPHPDPIKTKTHTLNHSFVESPNAGDNIYRFLVSVKEGQAEIELPNYFKFLNCDVQVFVTPKNGFGIGYGIIDEELEKVTIHANLDIDYNVLIIGTRKDYHAVKSWKGTERVKTKGEIEAYEKNLKNDIE